MAAGLTDAASVGRYLRRPTVAPPLDPGFRPAWLAWRALEAATRDSAASRRVSVAVEQPSGPVFVREALVFDDGHPGAPAGIALCERLVKSMLWTFGGSRVWVDGPDALVDALRRHYAASPTGSFDARLMGSDIYRAPFEVLAAPRADFPSATDGATVLGGHLDGCRIGFDLGASDRKAAAVVDGEVVFSEEVPWDPASHPDPQWHLDQIDASLRSAAAHLPRVDAIGGSAAGVYVDSEVRVASLFRSVPRDQFDLRVRGLFKELRAAWGVPLVVVNDGEVTALAGAMQAGVGGLLGVAMGSSEAAGYVTPAGALTSRLNELAFAPIDYAPDAPTDEWSGDRGCGVQYLSQQAAGRLLARAGIDVEPGMTLPERLVRLQALMADEDPRARLVYETIGTYLGYALLEYRRFYEFGHLSLLGRVMTGAGGDVIAAWAREVLEVEEPATAAPLTFLAVSERAKRHGQAVAAASLPQIPK
ncbi:MAG: ROK family protein [Candidatus Limnocylindrales bacterium]